MGGGKRVIEVAVNLITLHQQLQQVARSVARS